MIGKLIARLILCRMLRRCKTGKMYSLDRRYIACDCVRCGKVFKERRDNIKEIMFGIFLD